LVVEINGLKSNQIFIKSVLCTFISQMIPSYNIYLQSFQK